MVGRPRSTIELTSSLPVAEARVRLRAQLAGESTTVALLAGDAGLWVVGWVQDPGLRLVAVRQGRSRWYGPRATRRSRPLRGTLSADADGGCRLVGGLRGLPPSGVGARGVEDELRTWLQERLASD